MGVYNMTCMVSHLPILEGEPVVGFLLAQACEPGNKAYPDSLCRPLTPPIIGEYNGYGGLENIQEDGRILAILNEGLKVSYTCLDAFLMDAADGRLSCPARYGKQSQPVVLAMVKRVFFDLAVEEFKPSAVVFRRAVSEYLAGHKKAVELLAKGSRSPSGGGIDWDALTPEEYKYNAARFEAEAFLSGIGILHPVLSSFLSEGIDLTGVAAMESMLDNNRLGWAPVFGCGSQRGIDADSQIRFCKAILTEAERMKREGAEELGSVSV